ncbi:hypothetical protein ACVJBD_001127 [Rhizobium mongolense]
MLGCDQLRIDPSFTALVFGADRDRYLTHMSYSASLATPLAEVD